MISQRLKTIIGSFYQRFIRLHGAPREVALGLSLGVMIGMTPFFGVHFVSALVLATLFGWSKIAAFAGVNITNVFTAPFIYPVNYWVGLKLVGISRGVEWPATLHYTEMLNLVRQSPLILIDLTIGGIVLGAPLAAASYLLALRAVRLYRRRRLSILAGPRICNGTPPQNASTTDRRKAGQGGCPADLFRDVFLGTP